MSNIRALALFGVLLIAGCVDDQQTLEFSQMCGQPVPTDLYTCTYASTCSLFNGDGRLFINVLSRDHLEMQIQFDNQLPDNANADIGLLNGNDAVIEEFRLNYTVTTAGVSLPFNGDIYYEQTFVVPAAGSLSPFVYIVPPSVGQILATVAGTPFDMRVDIRARGHYKNGHAFEVGPFPVAVQVVSTTFTVPTCPTGKAYACCPSINQTSSCTCVSST